MTPHNTAQPNHKTSMVVRMKKKKHTNENMGEKNLKGNEKNIERKSGEKRS